MNVDALAFRENSVRAFKESFRTIPMRLYGVQTRFIELLENVFRTFGKREYMYIYMLAFPKRYLTSSGTFFLFFLIIFNFHLFFHLE